MKVINKICDLLLISTHVVILLYSVYAKLPDIGVLCLGCLTLCYLAENKTGNEQ